jgi:hypothetical protein
MLYMTNFKQPTVSTLLKSDTLSLWDPVADLKRWSEKDNFITWDLGFLQQRL